MIMGMKEDGRLIQEGEDGEHYLVEDTNIPIAVEIANILQKHNIVFFDGDCGKNAEKRMDNIFILVKELRRSYYA